MPGKTARMFPIAHRDDFLAVQLTDPEVILREGGDHIGLELSVRADLIEGKPRFEAARGALESALTGGAF